MSRGGGAVRQSLYLNQEQIEEITKLFNTIDVDGSGYIDANELGKALETVGIKLPGFEVRDLVKTHDNKVRDGKMDIEEFKDLYTELKTKYDMKDKWQKVITSPKGIKEVRSQAHEEVRHSVANEEQVAFSNWINGNFADDPDCKKYLPINPETNDLYTKCGDGILLCKMINFAQPDTIHEKAINKGNLSVYQILENQTLALRSAQSIGCNIVNIGPEDLRDGKEHLVLGLMWQIIRIGLLSDINLEHNPNLVALLEEGETLEDFLKLSPEEILIRWVNYHLRRSGCGRIIHNFTTDIKDSIAYTHLLHQIAPKELGVTTSPEGESNLESRAEKMLQEADKMKCRVFVSPKDVCKGTYKLNLAFVANLFNKYPALEPAADVDLGDITETREEKTYRNWMNSMGVSPYVNRLYSDLTDGLIIFQLYDIIKPGCVDWKKVKRTFKEKSAVMERIENCNYAVLLGKQCNFSLVGISGKDLYDGNKTLTLAIVWQLMRAYTLSILQQLRGGSDPNTANIDKEIVAWANSKLDGASKSGRISGFNDPGIADGKILIDLVDAVRPGAVNYSVVKSGKTDEEKLENAKYGLTVARRAGARIYALPEDVVEVKSKMVMTIFACLMVVDLQGK